MAKEKFVVVSKDHVNKKIQLHIVHSDVVNSPITSVIGDAEIAIVDDIQFNQFVEGQEVFLECSLPQSGAGSGQVNNSTTTSQEKDSMTASADTEVKDSASGASTGDSQAAAGSTTRAAGSQTAQTQAGSAAGAAGTVAQQEAVGDISPTEAWTVNLKRLVENALNMDKQLDQVLVANAQRVQRNAEDHDQALRNISLQALQNAVALAQRISQNTATHDQNLHVNAVSERERTVRAGDAMQVIREAALSDNPVLQDAVIASAVRAVAAEMNKKTA